MIQTSLLIVFVLFTNIYVIFRNGFNADEYKEAKKLLIILNFLSTSGIVYMFVLKIE